MAVRAPDFMFERRLYDGYRLTLGEGATSVVMDDDSQKNVLSNRDPMDSEQFTIFISQEEKLEFDRWFREDIRRSGFFVYEPVFSPTPRQRYCVLGRLKDSGILFQRLVDPELDDLRVWEIGLEVEFYSRRALRAPLELYPASDISVIELIHIPQNQRTRFDNLYQDPVPLDWSGLVRVDNLRDRRPPRFVMPDINETSSIIIRYATPISLQGFTQRDSMGNKILPMDDMGNTDDAMRTDGEYNFSTQGIIFYNPIGRSSYVYVFENGAFLPRQEIWRRREAAQVDSGDLVSGSGWTEARNPALLNNLGFIVGDGNLDDLNVLLLSRGLTEQEQDRIVDAQQPF